MLEARWVTRRGRSPTLCATPFPSCPARSDGGSASRAAATADGRASPPRLLRAADRQPGGVRRPVLATPRLPDRRQAARRARSDHERRTCAASPGLGAAPALLGRRPAGEAGAGRFAMPVLGSGSGAPARGASAPPTARARRRDGDEAARSAPWRDGQGRASGPGAPAGSAAAERSGRRAPSSPTGA